MYKPTNNDCQRRDSKRSRIRVARRQALAAKQFFSFANSRI